MYACVGCWGRVGSVNPGIAVYFRGVENKEKVGPQLRNNRFLHNLFNFF